MTRVPQVENHCSILYVPANFWHSVICDILEFACAFFRCSANTKHLQYSTAVVLKLGYSCHSWHFDEKIVTLCHYIYVTLLTQRYKENDTQADKSQNYCTYIVQNVHFTCTSTCTLLFVHVMILTFIFIKLFAYLEYYCDCESLIR